IVSTLLLHLGRSDAGTGDTATAVVAPRAAYVERSRLFAALEALTDTKIVPIGDIAPGTAASSITFATAPPAEIDQRVPRCEVLGGGTPARGHGQLARFGGSVLLDEALRHAELVSRHAPTADVRPGAGAEVIATIGGIPAWWQDEEREAIAVPIDELQRDETLTARLRSDPLGVCALISFLRRMHPHPWLPPRHHACFLFDDPNLHTSSYGFVDYRKLAEEARRHQFHVALATIPLD